MSMQLQLQCLTHCAQPLDLVCLDANCQGRGLICYLCKMQSHLDHQSIALKLFLSSFRESRTGEQYFVQQTAQIDNQLFAIHHKLLSLCKRILDMNIIQTTYQKFCRAVITEVQQFDKILIELQNVLQHDGEQKIKQLNKWICRYAGRYVKESEEQNIPKESLYIAYLKNRLNWLKQIQNTIQNISKKSSFDDEELLSLFVITESGGRLSLYFSEELKGTCMSILSPLRASMTSSGEQRMVLLQPHLGINRRIKKWRVKIQKLSSWIGVGVAHLDSIKSVNFNFSYTSPNHGNYLVSMNGYSWNGYKMQFNSKHQTFQFKTGDIIAVTYDPNANTVAFQKENEESIFTYDVDPSQKPIHAAVNMGGIGDCVEILL